LGKKENTFALSNFQVPNRLNFTIVHGFMQGKKEMGDRNLKRIGFETPLFIRNDKITLSLKKI